MFKISLTIMSLFLTYLLHPCVAKEELESKNSKKYHLSVCSIFKNKACELPEWIAYHRAYGVDHFYLYNSGSTDYYYNILASHVCEGIVTLVNWPLPMQSEGQKDEWALANLQITAYENAVNFLAREETKWLIFLDIDEFLECSSGDLKGFLDECDNHAGIALHEEFISLNKRKKIFNIHQLEPKNVQLPGTESDGIKRHGSNEGYAFDGLCCSATKPIKSVTLI